MNLSATSDQNTPLIVAAGKGDEKMLKLLLSHKADVNFQGTDGDTALNFAVASNSPRCVQMLRKFGADPTLKDNFGKAASDFSPPDCHPEIMKALDAGWVQEQAATRIQSLQRGRVTRSRLARGGSVDALRQIEQLSAAISAGKIDDVKTLLQTVSPNEKSKTNVFPLHLAIACNKIEVFFLWPLPKQIFDQIVDALLKSGVSKCLTDANGNGALSLAAIYGNAEILNRLLEAGFAVSERNNNGESPADLALKNNHKAIAERLTNLMANCSFENQENAAGLQGRRTFSPPTLLQVQMQPTPPAMPPPILDRPRQRPRFDSDTNTSFAPLSHFQESEMTESVLRKMPADVRAARENDVSNQAKMIFGNISQQSITPEDQIALLQDAVVALMRRNMDLSYVLDVSNAAQHPTKKM